MDNIWTTLISAFSGLLGAAIGGAGTYFSSKTTKTLEWKHAVRMEEIHKREALYALYLAEAGRIHILMQSSISPKSPDWNADDALTKLSDLFGQLKLIASPAVEESAYRLLEVATAQLGLAKLPPLRPGQKPLAETAAECRKELDALRARSIS